MANDGDGTRRRQFRRHLDLAVNNPNGSGFDIQAQLYDNQGNAISGVIPVNTTTEDAQLDPDVAALSGGGFVVAWLSSGFTSANLSAQIFDPAGNKVGGECVVAQQASDPWQRNVELAGLSSGGFVFTWTEGSDIVGQIFDAAGTAIGGTFLINTTTAGNQDLQKVAALANGGFAVTWQDDSLTDGTGGGATRAQVFDNLGNKIGGEILIDNSVGHQIRPNIDSTPDGGFVLAWNHYVVDYDLEGDTQVFVKGQFFDATGNRSGAEFLIGGESVQVQAPGVVVTDSGHLFVSWNPGSKRLLTLEHPVFANNDSNTTAENASSTATCWKTTAPSRARRFGSAR